MTLVAPATVGRYLLPAPRLLPVVQIAGNQQTDRTSLPLSIDGTDRRTNRRTDGHPTVTQTLTA